MTNAHPQQRDRRTWWVHCRLEAAAWPQIRQRVPAPGWPSVVQPRSDSRPRESTARKYRNRDGSRRTRAGRWGTVTCAYGRRWTCCLLFASRGSGVRVPLAPLVRDIIRTAGPGVQQQSTATGTASDAAHAFEWGFASRRLRPVARRSRVLGRVPGRLSRKNACGRVLRRPVHAVRGQRAESAVSGPALAAPAEGH